MMDPALLGRLVDEHSAALVLYARQWCATPEDIVQEAFLKLVVQKRQPEEPVAWLYRVVRNGAISAARSISRRRRHEAVAAAKFPAWFVSSDLTGLDRDRATAALQTLPVEQREVIVGHLWGGLTFDQIGELIGSSSSTAHRRYLEGLAALRERLGVSCPGKSKTRS
jgi:RNA polymerase sigma-70 factor (ECF subfamily)